MNKSQSETTSEFYRQDNVMVLEFLASAIATLANHQRIGAKVSDNLRLDLIGIHAGSDSRNQPLLLGLIDRDASALEFLEWRYGTQALSLNLLRLSVVKYLVKLQKSIGIWAAGHLHEADLQFNDVGLRLNDLTAVRPLVRADIPLGLVEHLGNVFRQLEAFRQQLLWANDSLVSQNSEDEWLIDQAIAEAQGFAGCKSAVFLGLDEKNVLSQLVPVLRNLVDTSMAFGRQLPDGERQVQEPLKILCDNLSAECDKLKTLSLPDSGRLMDWEARRSTLLRTLQSIDEIVQLIAGQTLRRNLGRPDPASKSWWLTDAAQATVVQRLILTEKSLPEAKAASMALHDYLKAKQVKPSELLPSELATIHPALGPDILHDLQRLEEQPIGEERLKSYKSSNLSRRERLRALFDKSAPSLILLLAILLPPGCGLKTNVKSDIPELRPDLPISPPGPEEKPNSKKRPNEGVLP